MDSYIMQWHGKEIGLPDSVGKPSFPKNTPAGTSLESTVIDEVGIECPYDNEACYKVFQVLQYKDGNEYAFRITYWRYNDKREYWVYGQYSQMISPEEWSELYQKAVDKGFFEKYKN